MSRGAPSNWQRLTHPETGEMNTVAGWAAELGMSRKAMYKRMERLRDGTIDEAAVFRPTCRRAQAAGAAASEINRANAVIERQHWAQDPRRGVTLSEYLRHAPRGVVCRLAAVSGCNPKTLQRARRGERISYKAAEAISRATDGAVSIEALTGWSPPEALQ